MFYRPQDGHGLPHNPLNAIVAPRPIGWVSTRGRQGDNLAPYSFFNLTAYVPPQIMFASTSTKGDRDGTKALIDVLLGHRTIPADAIVAGLDAALATGSVDAQVVLIEARRSAEDTVAPVIPIGTHRGFERPEPSIDHYDDLLEGTP